MGGGRCLELKAIAAESARRHAQVAAVADADATVAELSLLDVFPGSPRGGARAARAASPVSTPRGGSPVSTPRSERPAIARPVPVRVPLSPRRARQPRRAIRVGASARLMFNDFLYGRRIPAPPIADMSHRRSQKRRSQGTTQRRLTFSEAALRYTFVKTAVYIGRWIR